MDTYLPIRFEIDIKEDNFIKLENMCPDDNFCKSKE